MEEICKNQRYQEGMPTSFKDTNGVEILYGDIVSLGTDSAIVGYEDNIKRPMLYWSTSIGKVSTFLNDSTIKNSNVKILGRGDSFMRIWRAQYVLLKDTDNNWRTNFSFHLLPLDYKTDLSGCRWIALAGDSIDSVPKSIDMSYLSDGSVIITQGFDYMLEDEEVEKLKNKMSKMIERELTKRKEDFLKELDSKLLAIKEV